MAIQNGTERIESLRSAMHREVDKLVDDVIINGFVQGFTISFDCGYDRVLTMDLRVENLVPDANGHCLTLTGIKIEQEVDSEGEL